MLGPITYLDAALLALCFISGLLAMYRGFAREMLSIASWLVAAAASFYVVIYQQPIAAELADKISAPVKVAQGAIGAVVFLIVLIVVHLITGRISDAILDSRIGMIDRVLGFLFGVARGFIIIVVSYMLAAFFLCKGSQTGDFGAKCGPGDLPVWVERAISLPAIVTTSNFIFAVVDAHLPSSLTAPPGEQPPPPQEEQQQAP